MLDELETIYNEMNKCSLTYKIEKDESEEKEKKKEKNKKSKKENKENIIDKVDELEIINEIDILEREEEIEDIKIEHELNEDEAACIEIPTKSGEVLYLDIESNIIYKLLENEDGGSEIGRLIHVKDELAPIYRDNNNYIVGNLKNINKEEYMVCSISNRVYKNGDYIGILKTSSKGTMTIKR